MRDYITEPRRDCDACSLRDLCVVSRENEIMEEICQYTKSHLSRREDSMIEVLRSESLEGTYVE